MTREPQASSASPRTLVLLRGALLALIWAIFIFSTTYATIRSLEPAYQGAQDELRGIVAIQKLQTLLEAIERSRMDWTDAGRVNVGSGLDELADDPAIASFLSGAELGSLRKTWRRALEQHGPLQPAVRDLGLGVTEAIDMISERSHLSSDRALVSSVGPAIPELSLLVEHLSLAALGAASLAESGPKNSKQRNEIVAELSRVREVGVSLGRRSEAIAEASGSIRGDVVAAEHSFQEQTGQLLTTIERVVVARAAQHLVTDVRIGSERALRASYVLLDTNLIVSQRILEGRLARARQMRQAVFTLAAFEALLAAGLIWWIAADTMRLARRRSAQEQERKQLRATNRALIMSKARFHAVIDNSEAGIILFDTSGGVLESNAVIRTLFGVATDEFASRDDPIFREILDGNRKSYQFQKRAAGPHGADRWFDVFIAHVSQEESEQIGAVAFIDDITERKALEDRLRHEATHDPLTDLPNRVYFVDWVGKFIATNRELAEPLAYAVLFVDIDNFKLINDTLGHAHGDRLLKTIARRLRSSIREHDLVARLHGDEFAIFAEGLADRDTILAIVDQIQADLRAPVYSFDQPVFVLSSMGIVIGDDHYERIEDILRDADAAMYRAKQRHRGGAVFFDGDMREAAEQRMALSNDMRASVDRDEFRMVYQPIVRMDTGALVGFESLLRWRHPARGEVSPTVFIPIAEESDLIVRLGTFALRQACLQLATLDRKFPGGRQLRMNVNVSVHQLLRGNVIRDVRESLSVAGISGARLALELTESALVETGPAVLGQLSELKAMGIRLYIDDFGTGYSSLRYLNDFPIDTLKIDQTFVRGKIGGLANRPIVEMLITLATSLGMDLVAEGVDSIDQREELLRLGCSVAQGYFFARPLEAALVEKYVSEPPPHWSRVRSTSIAPVGLAG